MGMWFQDQFEQQKKAYAAHPMPSARERIAKLKALKKALLKHKDALCDAMSKDFGHRSHYDSLIGDIMPCLALIKYSLRHLRGWMRPERRKAGLMFAPARVHVTYQPLGVVGIVVPWNFPVTLSVGPLVSALSAGNRVMIKMSEFTPTTNKVVKEMLAEVFSEDEVCLVEGEVDVATAFTALPFDHLLFTGSIPVGRHVMRAAADNLTPVTLELGGKSPALVAPDMDVATAVDRLIYGKCLNAGQICVAPDYVLAPRNKLEAFASAYQKRFQELYPEGIDSQDYTSIINDRQYARLTAWLDDAKAKGAKVIACGDKSRDDKRRRLTTHLIMGANNEMKLMQEEIFGPLLPVIPYDDVDEAFRFIKERPRPLALYLMSFDRSLQDRMLTETHAGGMCINDTTLHAALDDAPFGGIGPSGMGHYHGREGFLTFSKAKTVLTRGRLNSGKLMQPPYNRQMQKLLMRLFLR